jgi:starch synthase
MAPTIKVLFLAAEAEPFIKVGGLADVAGSLLDALRRLPREASNGTIIDIRLILPLHRLIKVKKEKLTIKAEFLIYRGDVSVKATLFEMDVNGLPVYFIDGEPLSSAPGVYSNDPVPDREKYTFFSLACLEMLRYLDWTPDILHANDWHTALALFAQRTRSGDPSVAGIRTVLTVHNLPFMGGDGRDVLSAYGLIPPKDDVLPDWAHTQPLPLGLWSADAIIPVSPAYAEEITTPEFGCGLESYLRMRAKNITGILNGLDVDSYNPATDGTLASQFDVRNPERRSINKEFLQKTLGLPVEPKTPLIGMVGRVDQQKGVDIAINALMNLRGTPWQFVLLGSGDPAIESSLHTLQAAFLERVHIALRYDAELGRRIYAGADIFLMPSRYEPCGLAQMIAMHYGAVPVARATGGLKDTVFEGKNGFLFQDASPESLLAVLAKAINSYSDREEWNQIQWNGMTADYSWERSARSYANIYLSLLGIS